jgi:hypothetical protein
MASERLRQNRGDRRPHRHGGDRLHRHLLGAGDQEPAHPTFTCISAERAGLSLARHRGAVRLGVFWKRATAPAALWAFVIGMVGGFARLAADLVMRNDADAVSKLKVDLYHGVITQAQYDAGIAAIRAKFGPPVRFLEHSLALLLRRLCLCSPPR